MLTYAGVCWRMLACAGVCWRVLACAAGYVFKKMNVGPSNFGPFLRVNKESMQVGVGLLLAIDGGAWQVYLAAANYPLCYRRRRLVGTLLAVYLLYLNKSTNTDAALGSGTDRLTSSRSRSRTANTR
jgi:hypothetical protein